MTGRSEEFLGEAGRGADIVIRLGECGSGPRSLGSNPGSQKGIGKRLHQNTMPPLADFSEPASPEDKGGMGLSHVLQDTEGLSPRPKKSPVQTLQIAWTARVRTTLPLVSLAFVVGTHGASQGQTTWKEGGRKEGKEGKECKEGKEGKQGRKASTETRKIREF